MISIIMIVYDVERYVEQSIKSVLDQTYRDMELILVVGHGTDMSEAICARYAAMDERIKLIIGEAKGIADARNQGLAAATGDYIGFVDSDDYIEPDMFERMLLNITEYDADIAVCGRFYEYKNATLKDEEKPATVLSASEAIAVTLGHEGFFLHLWDKLFKRHIFDDVQFRTDVTVEDRIVTDRLLSRAKHIVYEPIPLYHFRERSGSNSKRSGMIRNNINANLLMEEFIKKEHPELSQELNSFMLYEFITAIQTELLTEDTNKEDIRQYSENVRRLLKEPGNDPGMTLRIKALRALYFPGIIKIYTARRQKNTAAELERFP